MNRVQHVCSVGLLGALLVVGTGCNGSDLASIGGPAAPEGSGDPDHGIDPGDPHNGGEDVPGPETAPSDWDWDGDGIPNEDDHIPCMAFYAKIWNQEVSSAEVNLNQETVVDASYFPTDEVFQEFINPVVGINQITFGGRVQGSPEDELHIEIWDMAATPTNYLHETIVRGNGRPDEVTLFFEIYVTC